MLNLLNNVSDLIVDASPYSKSKSDTFAEVFTPNESIKDQIAKVPKSFWFSPERTILDPCTGKGNYPIIVAKLLFKTLAKAIPDERERLKHIIENMIFMCEYQDTSANFIAYHFQFGMDLKVNLYRGDTLQMPEDFFELSYDERREKYPDNCVLEAVEPEKMPEITEISPSLPRSERVSEVKPSKTSAKTKKSPKIKGEKPDMTMTFVDVEV